MFTTKEKIKKNIDEKQDIYWYIIKITTVIITQNTLKP